MFGKEQPEVITDKEVGDYVASLKAEATQELHEYINDDEQGSLLDEAFDSPLDTLDELTVSNKGKDSADGVVRSSRKLTSGTLNKT